MSTTKESLASICARFLFGIVMILFFLYLLLEPDDSDVVQNTPRRQTPKIEETIEIKLSSEKNGEITNNIPKKNQDGNNAGK